MALLLALAMMGSNFLWLTGRPWYSIPEDIRTQYDVPAITYSKISDVCANLSHQQYEKVTDYMEVAAYDKIVCGREDVRGREDALREKFEDREIHPSDCISVVRRTGTDFVLQFDSGEDQWVQLPIFWYEGYQAIDAEGETVDVRRSEDGQVCVHMLPSSGNVHIWYGGLPWFHIVDGISLVSFCGFCWMMCRRKTHCIE